MTRPRRFMTGNASSQIPSSLLFVDTEARIHNLDANRTELTLRLWCSDYVRLENSNIRSSMLYDGTTADEFWRLVDEKVQPKKDLWILAHNAKYDMTQLELWEQFDNGRFIYNSRSECKNYSIMAIDGRPFFIKTKHKSGGWVWIVCTTNYWNKELKNLGESIGLPKLPVDLVGDNEEYIRMYCRRDVEIVKTIFTNMLQDWSNCQLGNFRTSAAGLSIQNFKHWHSNTSQAKSFSLPRYNIANDPDNPQIDFERDGFMGGRIEAFYFGDYNGTVYHLDVQSMYPSVMRNGLFPIDRYKTLDNPQVGYIAERIPAYECVAECLINSSVPTYPVRFSKRQIHAKGQFWTVLCGEELERAINNGDVHRISKAILYKTAPLFRHWVDYWWKRRKIAEKAGDCGMEELCKILLKSLHGKFAQRGTKWQDVGVDPPMLRTGKFQRWGSFLRHDVEQEKTIKYRVLAGKVQEESCGPNPEHCFPAISAIISANAREKLRRLIDICPKKSVLYTAVDSLIVTEEGFKALLLAGEISENTLGKLSIKGKHSYCHIRSQGCYQLDEVWTACGLWGKAEMDYMGQWTAQNWSYDTFANFDHDGRVFINMTSVEEPRRVPKGYLDGTGWTNPFTISKTTDFYNLPISEQRKEMFEKG